jgi:hypothetical protein
VVGVSGQRSKPIDGRKAASSKGSKGSNEFDGGGYSIGSSGRQYGSRRRTLASIGTPSFGINSPV